MKNTPSIGLIVALSLLLVSCDKGNEWPDNNPSGSEIPVRVRLLGVAGTESGTITRSAALKEPQENTISIGSGLLMNMSVEETPSPLRATKHLLEDGKRFRVIAVTATTPAAFVSHGDFEMVNGASSLTSPTLHVPGGASYDFICISYNNSSTLPPINHNRGNGLKELEVNNSSDFLWWKTANPVTVNSDADAELDIELHHMLVKVKMVIDCTYNGWNITKINDGIYFDSAARTTGRMDLTTGTTTSTTGNPYISWPQPLPSVDDEQTSNTTTIFPMTEGYFNVYIPIETIERDGLSAVPSSMPHINFSGLTLNPGMEYTLRLRVWTPIFAKSNIYWDGDASSGELTFSIDAADDLEYLQGVFFKWGSLVGISPAQKPSPNPNNFSSAVPVYIPSGSGWAPSSYTAWYLIPYWDSGGTTAVIDDSDYASFKGDICTYLGTTNSALAGYRLPTYQEFGNNDNYLDVWTWGNPWPSKPDYTIGNPYGTYNFKSTGHGYIISPVHGTILPASGYRGGTSSYDGNLSGVGGGGETGEYTFYRSSTPRNTGTDDELGFMFYTVDIRGSGTKRSHGVAVRCVKKIDPNGNY
jgi:hypothetical protein